MDILWSFHGYHLKNISLLGHENHPQLGVELEVLNVNPAFLLLIYKINWRVWESFRWLSKKDKTDGKIFSRYMNIVRKECKRYTVTVYSIKSIINTTKHKKMFIYININCSSSICRHSISSFHCLIWSWAFPRYFVFFP